MEGWPDAALPATPLAADTTRVVLVLRSHKVICEASVGPEVNTT